MDAIEKMEAKAERRKKKGERPKVGMHNKNFATLVANSIANSQKKSKKKRLDNRGSIAYTV